MKVRREWAADWHWAESQGSQHHRTGWNGPHGHWTVVNRVGTHRRQRAGMGGGPERGSATVLVVGAVAAVVVVLTGVLVVCGVVRDVHRARAAADLAALAAAGPVAVGGGVDCGVGAAVAAANGAVLTGCAAQSDGSVLVVVAVRSRGSPGWAGLPAAVSARARAGVVDSEPP
jgi:secretion/DNA translocation related TadE-like protein